MMLLVLLGTLDARADIVIGPQRPRPTDVSEPEPKSIKKPLPSSSPEPAVAPQEKGEGCAPKSHGSTERGLISVVVMAALGLALSFHRRRLQREQRTA